MGRCADRGTFAAGRPAAIAAALLIASLSPAGVARAQTGRHADTAATPLSAPGAQVEVAQRGFVERLRREPWEFTVAPYLWVTTVQGTTGIG